MEVLAGLRPVFTPDGTVTAGNSCPLNDGAAAVLVMSAQRAERLGRAPACANHRLEPLQRSSRSTWALAPCPRSGALLEQTGHAIEEIDIVEINEAFAAQVVPCMRELGITDEQLNPFGGAIALGHPFGMTGARIMATLLNGLERSGGRLGIEAMCVAGGMGQAMLVERI